MKIAFLIICYSNHDFGTLNICVNSIRRFYKNTSICIIDNCQTSNIYKGDNVLYHSNKENGRELGAIWKAYELYPDVDRFIIMHDSTMLINTIPVDIETNETLFFPFWRTEASGYSPVIPWVENKLETIGIKMEYNKEWHSVSGCMCIIDRVLLSKLFYLKANTIIGYLKHEAVGTEILFGYLMKHILQKDVEPLHEFAFNDYYIGRYNSIWIKKFKGGQGITHIRIVDINKDSVLHPSTPKKYQINDILYNSLYEGLKSNQNQWYKHFSVRFDTYPEDSELLMNSFPDRLEISPKNEHLSDILNSVRHLMFTKKYFKDSYIKQLDNIIHDRVKIL